MELHLPDLRVGYRDVLGAILKHGELAAPRGAMTRELLGATLFIDNPADTLPLGTGRKVNSALAACEALQLVGGYSNPAQLNAISPLMKQFEDQGAYHGAYGPRVRAQMESVERRLLLDPQSRRAVVTIWDPLRDGQIEGVKNYPCTTELAFSVRDDKLVMFVNMRANDGWHGLGYDAFVFGQLQLTLANVLGIEAGQYIHHCHSLHLYEDHWEAASQVADGSGATVDAAPARGFSGPSIYEAMHRARLVGDGFILDEATPSEEWYMEKLAKYVPDLTV